MDGVNLNTGSATPLPVEIVDPPVRLRNEQNETQPGGAPQQSGPRVNEGPSTVTTVSPQALQLAQQELASRVSEPSGTSANRPPDNPTQQTSDTSDSSSAADEAARAGGNAPGNAEPPGQSGRLINDESPNGLLRN